MGWENPCLRQQRHELVNQVADNLADLRRIETREEHVGEAEEDFDRGVFLDLTLFGPVNEFHQPHDQRQQRDCANYITHFRFSFLLWFCDPFHQKLTSASPRPTPATLAKNQSRFSLRS